MAISEQIAEFTAFAQLVTEQQGEDISLDDVYQQWKEIEPREIAIIQERLASYDAGQHGRPADEVMIELRQRLLAKFGK